MQDWRIRLGRWIHVWNQLAELTQDCFPVRLPATGWPSHLPSCPALADFYACCDGGTFGQYDIDSAAELNDPSTDDWLKDSPGLNAKPGQFVQFGTHDYGHTLLWDSTADEVVLYSPDDEKQKRLGRTIEQFLNRLFHPSAKSENDSTQLWAQALAEADMHA